MKNKLTIPYYIEKADIYTKVFDLNYIMEKYKLSQVENYQTFESFEGADLSSMLIKNMNLTADSIYLRNLIAKDFMEKCAAELRRWGDYWFWGGKLAKKSATTKVLPPIKIRSFSVAAFRAALKADGTSGHALPCKP